GRYPRRGRHADSPTGVRRGARHARRAAGQGVRPRRRADRPGRARVRHRGPLADQRDRRGNDTLHRGSVMDTVLLFGIGGGVLLIILLVLLILSRIKVAGPNEAFIVTGRKGRAVTTAGGGRSTDLSGQKVVMGASVFDVPFVQRLQALDLSSRRIHVEIRGAV